MYYHPFCIKVSSDSLRTQTAFFRRCTAVQNNWSTGALCTSNLHPYCNQNCTFLLLAESIIFLHITSCKILQHPETNPGSAPVVIYLRWNNLRWNNWKLLHPCDVSYCNTIYLKQVSWFDLGSTFKIASFIWQSTNSIDLLPRFQCRGLQMA